MGKFWLIGCTVAYNKQLATYDTEINACAGLMTDQPRFIKYSMPIYLLNVIIIFSKHILLQLLILLLLPHKILLKLSPAL